MSARNAKTDITGFSGQNSGNCNSAKLNCLKATGNLAVLDVDVITVFIKVILIDISLVWKDVRRILTELKCMLFFADEHFPVVNYICSKKDIVVPTLNLPF